MTTPGSPVGMGFPLFKFKHNNIMETKRTMSSVDEEALQKMLREDRPEPTTTKQILDEQQPKQEDVTPKTKKTIVRCR